MAEPSIRVVGKEGSGIHLRTASESSASVMAAREAAANQTSALSRAMCAPSVRVADQAALVLAVIFSLFSSPFEHGETFEHFLGLRISMRNLLVLVGLLVVWRFFFWVAGTYQPRLNPSLRTPLWRVPLTAALCAGVLCPILLWVRPGNEAILSCVLFWFIAASLMLMVRAAVLIYEQQIRPAFRRRRTVLICGTGVRARSVLMGLPGNRDFKYQLAGFVDSRMQSACSRFGILAGGFDELETILMRQPIDEVIVALPIKSHFNEIQHIVDVCGRAGIQTQYPLLNLRSEVAKNHSLEQVEGTRVTLEMVHRDHRLVMKNFLDRVVSAVGLILLSPLLIAIAIGVKLSSKGPVFFVQQRYGLNKRRFGMIKFRSMVMDAEAKLAALEHLNENDGPTFKMKRDPRITAFGAFIRRTSLDELPQLINVLKGDMSLVGPRPLPLRDVERFSEPWLMRRFSVKPGITGLWQVSGRSNLDFSQAIKLDLRYIDHWSLIMDAEILFRTFSAVVRSDGAY